jgi:hypothetical protein
MIRKRFVLGLALVVGCGLGVGAPTSRAADIGTAFTYQGNLENVDGPVTDTCDFRFGLWDAAAGGNQQGASPQPKIGVAVTGGVFTVPDLDFGVGAINGAARWLEIEVQCPPDVGFTLLLPRVELTPAPHAIRAAVGVGPPNALEVDTATGFVGVGTDSPLFPLHVSTASASGRAVYGVHTAAAGVTYGGFFESDSTDGTGVYSEATSLIGTAIGGHFESFSTDGRGVYGEANASSGTNYGGYFTSNSTSGRGVYGRAANGNGTTYGVYGESNSDSGFGVYGYATNNTGSTYGGYFESDSTMGVGIYGLADAASGFTHGGSFRSDSTSGKGVYGAASAGTGNTDGVYGVSVSTSGTGVRGWASANSGTTYGVYGQCVSPSGFAGYFTGPAGSRNYFARSIGIGITSPDATFHVADGSDASLSSGSGYVVLGDTISSNLVLDSNEIIARNNGAAAELFLNNGSGNVGILPYDFASAARRHQQHQRQRRPFDRRRNLDQRQQPRFQAGF